MTDNREVEQTQLVRVRVCVTSYFVDDVIIICVPRNCSTHYRFARTCKLWSTRLSLHVDIAIKWRWDSPLRLYKMVFMSFKNENIQQKRLESTKLVTKSDHTLGCWNCIYHMFLRLWSEISLFHKLIYDIAPGSILIGWDVAVHLWRHR